MDSPHGAQMSSEEEECLRQQCASESLSDSNSSCFASASSSDFYAVYDSNADSAAQSGAQVPSPECFHWRRKLQLLLLTGYSDAPAPAPTPAPASSPSGIEQMSSGSSAAVVC
ncbi:hypothetical protein AWZ03_012685 [Drosophila navojoa]|uniref:Uncharacterized protein n=1 Tax=Drosophila navojoa TaxID=7232 RepID=A0A484AZ85_DRONA|nr:hypothetical protein AWZ03_012685 [Drosophila navojoa]